MKKPTRFSFALVTSAAALSLAVGAPAAFADGGHGGHGGGSGRGSDDSGRTVRAPATGTTAPPVVNQRHHDVNDNDVNDNDVNENNVNNNAVNDNAVNDNDVNDDRGADDVAPAT